jgi:DNA-binding GntR family transcriptional regulator
MDQEVPKKRGPTPFPEPIARVSLHDELVARLRDMVIEGEIAPGSRVPERELCQRFHVSRTPLREALKVLAADGLIQLAPNRGARVAELTEADVEEMFPVMGALEALAGELAASRITEEGLAEVRALHYQMVLHHKRGELAPYFRLNQQIHEKIHRGLAGRIRRARYLANMSAQRWARAVEEHEAILAALEARDGPRLGALLKDHLKNKCETVKEALQSENGEGGQAASNS